MGKCIDFDQHVLDIITIRVVEVLSKAFKRFKDVKRAETGGLGKKYVLMTSISSQ